MITKPEAFLSLEASLSLRLYSTLKALTSNLYRDVEGEIAAKKWESAERMMRGLDLSQVFTLNKAYITYVSNLAILFGANRVSSSPGTSAVGMGFEKTAVEMVVDAFRQGISLNLQEALIDDGLQMIAQERHKAAPREHKVGSYLGTVLKAAKKPALLPFQSFMDKKGKSKFHMASSLHTSRLAAFGYTAEASYLGITDYQINEQLDGRTCPLCRLMHGKVFRVQDARNLLDIVIRTQDPDELKSLQPWPNQSPESLKEIAGMTSDALVSKGWHVPPFHPRCRGLLAKVGKAPKVLTGQPQVIPEHYVATEEDFAQLGLNFPPSKVQLWNTLMQTSPAEVLANLSGKTTDQVLLETLGKDNPLEILGVEDFIVNQTGVNLSLKKSVFGSKQQVTQDYYFRKDKSLFVGSIEVGIGDEVLVQKILRTLFGTAKSTAMTSLSMVADGDISGYAWARYGFSMKPDQWASVKKQIIANMNDEWLTGVSVGEKKAFDLIMESPDPSNVFSLADLPILGEKALSGTTWVGSLDFNDPEAISRFMSAMGIKS